MPQHLRRYYLRIALILILAGAAALRYSGTAWDSYQLLHPDERFLLMVTSALRAPSSVGEYLNEARSPLNPRNKGYSYFAYGTLPLMALKGVTAGNAKPSLADLAQSGRIISATLDLGVVVWTYLLALQLYRDRRIALLAAFFYAFAVLPIQQAHFFVVDPFLNFFLAGALYFLIRYQRAPGWRPCAAMGLFLGLAAACKVTAAELVPIFLAVVLAKIRWAPSIRLRSALLHVFITGMIALAVFRVAQPEVFRSPNPLNLMPSVRWLNNMAETSNMSSSESDYPPGHQWAGRTPLLFPWSNMVLWGLGIPLGLALWTGWLLAGRRLLKRRRLRHLVPVLWIAAVFLIHGTAWLTSMRYFLPIYGMGCVLAAWVLVRWIDLTTWRRTAILATASVALLSLLWAVAFTSIYRRPHSRVAASTWIYAHIPPGSSISSEHWDDALPVRMGGIDPYSGPYHGVVMRWYDEDSPEKLASALKWLDQTGYLVLSSNRLYGSIPRLPARYPMTTLYYRALFDGTLGFERIRDFESFPALGPLVIPTRSAEEAFTVYDHPVVTIFRKTGRYSHERAYAILSRVNWGEIVHAPARQAAAASTALLMPPGTAARQRHGQSWDEIFPAFWLSRNAPALTLLGLVYLLSLATAPLLFLACSGLPDRGYAFSKTAGFLLTGWLAWLGACSPWIAFERGWIWTVIAFLAAAGAWAGWRQRTEIRAFLRARWRLLLAIEVVFVVAFAAMAMLRCGNPDLWQPFFGGEKPMDFALLNAAVRASGFPLFHPWYSGGFVNYYYFGFVLVAALLKATAVLPEVGYNIIIPLLYGMAASTVFALTYALTGAGHAKPVSTRLRALASAGAVAAVLVLGNLKQLTLFIAAMARLGGGAGIRQSPVWPYCKAAFQGFSLFLHNGWEASTGGWVWYFDATRAYNCLPGEPAPINEFPFFTFYFGDLHAHLMALPLFLLLLGLAAAIATAPWAMRRASLVLYALAAVALGALPATNTWDTPAAALLIGGALWLSCRRAAPQPRNPALAVSARWAAILAAGWLCLLPFTTWFVPGYRSIIRWPGSQTELVPFLLVHGVFLIIVGPAVWLAAACSRRWKIVACTALLAAPLFRVSVTALLLILLCTVGRVLYRERRGEELRAFSLLLAAAGIGLILVPEWIVLRGDVGRMNTVFKFTFQAWALLGISAAVLLCWVVNEWRGWRRSWRIPWAATAILLAAGCLAYPLTAPHFRSRDRLSFPHNPGWDGMAFLRDASIQSGNASLRLKDDLGIIEWLRQNTRGTPVIAEYNTDPVLYGWGNRISIYTGLPAIIGWNWHVRQQMAGADGHRVDLRIRDVQQIYQAGDPEITWKLLRKYNARYLVWGTLERAYAAGAASKLQSGLGRYWDVVYDSAGSRIYRVRD